MAQINDEDRGSKALRATHRTVGTNKYECTVCADAGIPHEIKDGVPHGVTDKRSCWGPGIPTTRAECTSCGRWSGPWVSTTIVGDGW